MSCKITFESIITFCEYDLLLILHTSAINVEFYSLSNTFYFIILCYIEQKIYLFLWRPAISSFKCPEKSGQQGSTRHLKVRTLKVNLSSLILKTVEKLLDRYIRDEILSFYPLHQNQFAYQAGKSTDTALHSDHTHREHSGTYGNNTWSLRKYLGGLEQYLC